MYVFFYKKLGTHTFMITFILIILLNISLLWLQELCLEAFCVMIVSRRCSMKLIFCDMDGSLLNRRSKISSRTLETLIKLQEKGIGIILSSGRHINSLKKYGNMLHFEKYPMSGYSCINGQSYHDH